MSSYDEDNSLIYRSEAERLWFVLTGHYRDEFYVNPDETAAELALFGEAVAKIVLHDVRAAVVFEADADEEGEIVVGYREDVDVEPYEEVKPLDLTHGNPHLDVDQLGGEDNIPRIRKMLKRIGGQTAREAFRILQLADGPVSAANSQIARHKRSEHI